MLIYSSGIQGADGTMSISLLERQNVFSIDTQSLFYHFPSIQCFLNSLCCFSS